MKILHLTVGMFMSNCYLPYCQETREAIVIDPGDEGERILSVIEENELVVKAIVNTHAHIDHVSALSIVAPALNVPVMMHEGDTPIYENLAVQASMYGLEPPRDVNIDRFLADGDTIAFGNVEGEVMHTPGHSPGSISILFKANAPHLLVSGDTLFKGSIGRTDLYGGNFDTMARTLRQVFLPLADDTVVFPGHGEPTTMGVEKRSNPFLMQLR
jgi:hydroxyacylglutathione hydrolase